MPRQQGSGIFHAECALHAAFGQITRLRYHAQHSRPYRCCANAALPSGKGNTTPKQNSANQPTA
ncbi:hypothetical protein AA0313_2459 [Acetobacter indonesiensis NRIC 0313]|nr:hypothetical protein AA0313_2459 [Acetobacter indonesiensis NRIC 0313]